MSELKEHESIRNLLTVEEKQEPAMQPTDTTILLEEIRGDIAERVERMLKLEERMKNIEEIQRGKMEKLEQINEELSADEKELNMLEKQALQLLIKRLNQL